LFNHLYKSPINRGLNHTFSFAKYELRKIHKTILSDIYGGGFYKKMYKKSIESFKNDDPPELKITWEE
jgi:hypothetical protein